MFIGINVVYIFFRLGEYATFTFLSYVGILLLLALNALWLFPLAWTATVWPKFSFLLVILAYLPLLAGMAKARKLG